MSILIKGMKMPKGCLLCPLASTYYVEDTEENEWVSVRCRVLNKTMQVQGAPNDCPLIELPDHGDLIDRDKLADELLEMARNMCCPDDYEYYDGIKEGLETASVSVGFAPVVIPAERNEE